MGIKNAPRHCTGEHPKRGGTLCALFYDVGGRFGFWTVASVPLRRPEVYRPGLFIVKPVRPIFLNETYELQHLGAIKAINPVAQMPPLVIGEFIVPRQKTLLL